jgi:pilus assembly protein Flp/PilA
MHTCPSVRVGRPIGPQNRGVADQNVGQIGRTFFFFGDTQMLSIFRRLMKSEKGATAIEYTLIASLIAVAAIAGMNAVGGKIQGVLTNVSGAMN